MCGISGVVDKTGRFGPAVIRQWVDSMTATMIHRGPDDSGVWVDPGGRVALGHRRLSVIDVSAHGRQPMLSESKRTAIVFNGELYNYRELKAELSACGLRFQTHSDTEVLLACLDRWGIDALGRFDAMFSFGRYDTQTRELLLARDIFGEKPLYYIDNDEIFAFSSELHALAVLPGFDIGVSVDTIAAYLCFQYVPTPRTIYDRAHKLPPAHWLKVTHDGAIIIAPYFKFVTSGEPTGRRSIDDLADELEGLLTKSIERRLISDVPLGAFLSGGVDSSTVAAIATKRIGADLNTYSIGFEGHADSEHFEAREIARHLGTKHLDRVISADATDLGTLIGQSLDEPNADTSCLPTYLLCKFAREQVTVALSGDGGDELFGGYGRYFNTVDEWARKQGGDPDLGWWNAGSVYLSNRILVFPDETLTQVLGEMPRALATMLERMRAGIDDDPRPLLNVLREHDAGHYMPGAVLAKVDRMSMQHALEVRAPLLGIDVARFAMNLAADECYQTGQGKRVLKQVARRYLPMEWLMRPKRGFGLPMDMWGAATLLPALRELLCGSECRLQEWIPRSQLSAYVAHLEHDFHAYRAWSLFILETWLRTHPAAPSGSGWLTLGRVA